MNIITQSAPPAQSLATAPTHTAEPPTSALTGAASWRAIIRQATLLWAITRLALLAFTYLALTLSPTRNPGDQVTPQAFLLAWKHWDANWYLDLATKGYFNPETVAFFPLYSLLTHIVSLPLSGNALLAGLIVGALGSLLAFIGLGLLTARLFGPANASFAIRALAAYPLAFFLAAPYTDALFLGLAALCLFFARGRQWRWAALLAFLAGLTRISSLALLPALLWEYAADLAQRHHIHPLTLHTARSVASWRATLRDLARALRADLQTLPFLANGVLLLGAIPAAFLLFQLYLRLHFGVFYNLLTIEHIYWHHTTWPIWRSIPQAYKRLWFTQPLTLDQARLLVDLIPLLLFGGLTLLAIRKLPTALTLYLLATLYLTISSPILDQPDIFISAGRYMLAMTPLFALLGVWMRRRPWLDLIIVYGGSLLQATCAIYYLSGRWLV